MSSSGTNPAEIRRGWRSLWQGADARPPRGASRISADFYGRTGLFGLILARFWRFWLRLAEYGVLTWCTSRNARHVFRRAATFHAINRPFIPRVRMACNAPTCGYPDWPFTDFIATAIWRTSCYHKKSQRSGMHPTHRRRAFQAGPVKEVFLSPHV